MSFCHKYKTVRSGSIYDLQARPEMSAHEEETTEVAEMNEGERNDETRIRFCPDMIEERVKVNLEPLHAQICPNTNDGDINPRQPGQRIHDGRYPRASIPIRIDTH